MIQEIKELLQDLIAPQLESIKGDIRALDAKFDARLVSLDTKFDTRFASLDTKIDSYRRELLSEIHRVEQTVDVRLASMDGKLALVDDKLALVDGKLALMDNRLVLMDERFTLSDEKMDAFRRELLVEIKASLN